MKSDAQLRQDIYAELAWEPALNASQIGIEVQDGTVNLTGHVDSYGEKWQAEHAAQRVIGIKGLAVEIDVRLPGLSRRTDAEIARAAQNVLEWTTWLPQNAVSVRAENGWLTLAGTVEWDYQRQRAKEAVRHLLGVTGVSDEIVVTPTAAVQCIKTEISAVLNRRVPTDARQIIVDVQGDEVTLSGAVHSQCEHDLATSAAWSTAGVRAVVDNMTVSQ